MIPCLDAKLIHDYKAIYDEMLEKEFNIDGWKLHRRLDKKKIYKHSVCTFCGHTIKDIDQ